MNVKNILICALIVAVLSLCAFNSVAAAPVSKFTPDNHSNYAANVNGRQQTFIAASVSISDPFHPVTELTIGVGQSVQLFGMLSSDSPATAPHDSLLYLRALITHGVPNATVNVQSMNADWGTWNTVTTTVTQCFNPNRPSSTGTFMMNLTPKVAGIYTYRATYDGDSNYAPAVSNVVALTVTN